MFEELSQLDFLVYVVVQLAQGQLHKSILLSWTRQWSWTFEELSQLAFLMYVVLQWARGQQHKAILLSWMRQWSRTFEQLSQLAFLMYVVLQWARGQKHKGITVVLNILTTFPTCFSHVCCSTLSSRTTTQEYAEFNDYSRKINCKAFCRKNS